MGAGNAKLVYAKWQDLPHAPLRMLVFMALVTKDADNPPQYWGGRETLALALGRMVPSPVRDDKDNRRQRETAFRAVERTIAQLTQAGAVNLVREGHIGSNAVYRLNLDRESPTLNVGLLVPQRDQPEASEPDAQRGPEPDAQRGPEPDAQRPKSPTLSVGPRSSKEEVRTEERNESVDLETAVTVTRANGTVQLPRFSSRGQQQIAEAMQRRAAARAAAKNSTEGQGPGLVPHRDQPDQVDTDGKGLYMPVTPVTPDTPPGQGG